MGTTQFKLKPDYEDQLVHANKWFNLERDGAVHGRVCLKIQWLYDSLLFFQKALSSHDEQIKMY